LKYKLKILRKIKISVIENGITCNFGGFWNQNFNTCRDNVGVIVKNANYYKS